MMYQEYCLGIRDLHGNYYSTIDEEDIEAESVAGVNKESRNWEAAPLHFQTPMFGFLSWFTCGRCKKQDFGTMTVSHLFKRKGKSSHYASIQLCCKCGVEICADPNKAVFQVLNEIVRLEDGMRSYRDWKKSSKGESYWLGFGDGIYLVGPKKTNPSVFWARTSKYFLKESFSSLEAAKAAIHKILIRDLLVHKERIKTLINTKPLLPKSEEEQKYEENDF